MAEVIKGIRVEFNSSATEKVDDATELLARGCRILAMEGHESGLAGQVTARGPRPGTYWTIPLGMGLEEAEASRMILVDDDLNPVDGDVKPNPATRFHMWIYRARPDVNAIVHTHPPAASTLAAAVQPLVIGQMDMMALYDDVAFLPYWPGVPVTDDEGETIAGALKDKSAIILANHGMLTVGRNIREAFYLAVVTERAAAMQIRASTLGGIKPIDPAEGRRARDFSRLDRFVEATFDYWTRKANRALG